MDSSFGNGPGAPGGPPGVTPAAALSAACERFLACRWRKPADSGQPDHCTHRDVLPVAGITGFTPESWCLDCAFFKAKRAPRKRVDDSPPTETWRW